MTKIIINVGRQIGSGGHIIAEKLAEDFGCKCYDRELLNLAAKESGFSEKFFEQNLGRVVPVLECYREKDNKNKEVRVVISYNTEMATEMAKRLIRQELEKKGEQLRSKFDQIQK